jgi:hypothetical protein
MGNSSMGSSSIGGGTGKDHTSPFIVALKFSFQSPSKLFIGTEYLACGDLHTHLKVQSVNCY